MSSTRQDINKDGSVAKRKESTYHAVDSEDEECFSNISADLNSHEDLLHLTKDNTSHLALSPTDISPPSLFPHNSGKAKDDVCKLSMDPTQRLIDAIDSLKESIADNTNVTVQGNRQRNRRRGTSTAQVNYKCNSGGMKADDASKRRLEKVVVEIRVVFLKIGEIDTLKELYHADAFIQAKWKEPQLDSRTAEELKTADFDKFWNPLIYIDNILSESKEATWVVAQRDPITNDVSIVERRRIKGVFLETLELNDFPLDVQDLTITITSERPDTEIELIPDEAEMSGINIQTFVDQQEWKLHEHIEVEKRTLTQEFSSTMKSHPCLAVRCRAARRPGYFYWNVFLIMFFITGLSFATFAVGPDKPENRLQLSFTLFLTSVAFKFVINQSLPKISYLTYMDKYVLMSLAILCIVSIWHAVVTLIEPPNVGSKNSTNASLAPSNDCLSYYETGEPCSKHRRKLQMVVKIEKDVFISFGILYILAHVIFIFWLYYDACRRRREMRKKDREYRNKIQFYQMVQTQGRTHSSRKPSAFEFMKHSKHHQRHPPLQHHILLQNSTHPTPANQLTVAGDNSKV